MQFGVSTACLFPEETLLSLKQLSKQNIKTVEIFLNGFCELKPEYLRKLLKVLQKADINVTSLHPFTSGMEAFFFASPYKSRMADGIELYKKYFSACNKLSAPRLVFHGDFKENPFPFEKHCENYMLLREEAKKHGVELCYENVVRCKCAFPENISFLRKYSNDDVSFVLDIKQMRRANVDTQDMLNAMCGKISLIHVSDYSNKNDCVIPQNGLYNFNKLFNGLKTQSFCSDIILELYRDGYQTVEELPAAADFLKSLYENKDGACL